MLVWDEYRGSEDGQRPAMLIKRLVRLPFWKKAGKVLSCRIDLHKFIAPDGIACFHTHPAWAVRIVLWGGYVEEIAERPDPEIAPMLYRSSFAERKTGYVGLVRPEFAHRVERLRNRRCSFSLWLRGPIVAKTTLVGWGWDHAAKPQSSEK